MQEFDAIYRDYHEDIFRFLLKLTLFNADLAEELTQETFYQAYLSIPRFEGRCHIKTWLCGIARNTCYLYLRKNKRENINMMRSEPTTTQSSEADYEHQRVISELVRAINAMEEPGRSIVLYRVFLDLPYAQIASLLGISEN